MLPTLVLLELPTKAICLRVLLPVSYINSNAYYCPAHVASYTCCMSITHPDLQQHECLILPPLNAAHILTPANQLQKYTLHAIHYSTCAHSCLSTVGRYAACRSLVAGHRLPSKLHSQGCLCSNLGGVWLERTELGASRPSDRRSGEKRAG